MRNQIINMDGEGLIFRSNRPESFVKTTNNLAEEALQNKNAFDFYRTFSRLNATYPNLHLSVTFPDAVTKAISIPGPEAIDASNVFLFTEILAPTRTRIVLDHVLDNASLAASRLGAELVAVNEVPLSHWLGQNYIFCKRVLRASCDKDFEETLLQGLLDWKGGPLVYTFKKDGEKFNVKVQFKKPEPRVRKYERRQCDWNWEKHYPGFKLVHKGYYACLFEKSDDPSLVILRVVSFQYKRSRNLDPKSPIQTMRQETDALKTVWLPMSGAVKHLILDLIDNGGGNEPMDYYRLLLQHPYQEQFVRFKKLPSLENEKMRNGIMNDDPALELWFQNLVKSGEWAAIPEGKFTKKVPMFCPDPARPCNEGMFKPDAHGFRGKLSILVNDNCVSTCDAVVFTLSKYLHAKLFGFYQAADTAYSRLQIQAFVNPGDPSKFDFKVLPQRTLLQSNAYLAQDVSVSRSVDETGRVVSGKALKLTKFVALRRSHDYHHDALFVALGRRELPTASDAK